VSAKTESASGGSTDVPAVMAPESAGLHRNIAFALLVGICALGAFVRAHGLTNFDLWFDDAWAAAPARVGWSKAVHMVLTAPGYGLALRLWIRLDPTTTWFLQLPSFVLGLVAIPAVYGLLRWFRTPRGMALLFALVTSVGPILVQYSTRLKEYPFDLLAACLILALAERARRKPVARSFAVLAGASVLVFLVSAGSAAILLGAWGALAVGAFADRGRLRTYVIALAAMAVGCVVVWVGFLRGLPNVLSFNWRRRGFLVDYRTHGLLERSVTLIFGGFVHGVFGVPVPPSFFRSQVGLHEPFVAVLGVLLFAVAIGTPVAASVVRREVHPGLAAALGLLVAIGLAVIDKVPLGDGRTDEALYPALFVCLAAVLQLATPRLRGLVHSHGTQRVVASALALAIGAGAVAFGVAHQSIYPTISLRGLDAKLKGLEQPGEVVVVDTFNSFGWCYYDLSQCRTQVRGRPLWPQGFRPVSLSPDVYISTQYTIPGPDLTAAQARATKIWYVGFTYGTFDVGAGSGVWNLPVNTYILGDLRRDGWHPANGPRTFLGGLHCYAQLYVRDGAAGADAHGPRA
jgi:hypothetical protein